MVNFDGLSSWNYVLVGMYLAADAACVLPGDNMWIEDRCISDLAIPALDTLTCSGHDSPFAFVIFRIAHVEICSCLPVNLCILIFFPFISHLLGNCLRVIFSFHYLFMSSFPIIFALIFFVFSTDFHEFPLYFHHESILCVFQFINLPSHVFPICFVRMPNLYAQHISVYPCLN